MLYMTKIPLETKYNNFIIEFGLRCENIKKIIKLFTETSTYMCI